MMPLYYSNYTPITIVKWYQNLILNINNSQKWASQYVDFSGKIQNIQSQFSQKGPIRHLPHIAHFNRIVVSFQNMVRLFLQNFVVSITTKDLCAVLYSLTETVLVWA